MSSSYFTNYDSIDWDYRKVEPILTDAPPQFVLDFLPSAPPDLWAAYDSNGRYMGRWEKNGFPMPVM